MDDAFARFTEHIADLDRATSAMTRGERIAYTLKRAGLSVFQYERLTGRNATVVQAWTEDSILLVPSERDLTVLADYCGCSLAWLRDGTETPIDPALAAQLSKLTTEDLASLTAFLKTLPGGAL